MSFNYLDYKGKDFLSGREDAVGTLSKIFTSIERRLLRPTSVTRTPDE